MADKIRVGTGYDIHPFVKKRKLVLGGVEIPFNRGLEGWSDADVLSHAVIDALLGAAALGDIGQHFPAGDERYRDISSLVLLKATQEKLAEAGWHIVNIDATIVAEEPKLAGYIEKMRQKLSRTLAINIAMVSVKASTANSLGCTGKGKGIEAQAVALISGG